MTQNCQNMSQCKLHKETAVVYTVMILIVYLLFVILSKKMLILEIVFCCLVQPNFGNIYDHIDDYYLLTIFLHRTDGYTLRLIKINT